MRSLHNSKRKFEKKHEHKCDTGLVEHIPGSFAQESACTVPGTASCDEYRAFRWSAMPKQKFAALGKTKKKSIKSKAKLSTKRKLSRFGKVQKKGHAGSATTYITRTKAVKKLQLSIKDFRHAASLHHARFLHVYSIVRVYAGDCVF